MAARARKAALIGLMVLFSTAKTIAEEPLSAIDWLSQSVVLPSAIGVSSPIAHDRAVVGAISTTPLATDALPETVTAFSLDTASLDAVGLLSSSKTGLPRLLWGAGKTDAILAQINRQRTETLPALQALLITVLLAEAEPPADAGPSGRMLLGRIDKLLSMGALDQAMAMMQSAGDRREPELFRRLFDVALLTGAEDRACRRMMSSASLSPALSARIFCLARSGDWQTAAVTLQTAQAIGQISPQDAELMTRFLDPELAETSAPLPMPSPVTPLELRMFEAIGEPLPIANLPLAFAHSDLNENTGWKSRLEAAERLSLAGVISPNLLLGFYTQQKPAASGGVWERVKAFQTFEDALASGAAERIAPALQAVMTAMQTAELEVVFAELFAQRLAAVPLDGPGADLVIRLQLLSSGYQELTKAKTSADPKLNFALALAGGQVKSAAAPDLMAAAIAAAWDAPEIPPEIEQMRNEKRTGELILVAAERILTGAEGQFGDVTIGLAILRDLGMEDVLRRTALELILLERRG
jgi:hypothetical protein